VLGIALLAVAIAAGGMSLWEYSIAARELERIEAEILSAGRAAEVGRAAPVARTAPQVPEAKVDAINRAIARLNVPWGELFVVFEADKPKDIALLALLPDTRKRSLVVHAEAANPRAMIEFVERLRAVPSFEQAFLVKHERREQDTGQPYRFVVDVRWKEER